MLQIVSLPQDIIETPVAVEEEQSSFHGYAVEAIYSIPSRSTPKTTLCSCVSYAKWYLDREGETWGNAGAIKPVYDEPKIDRIILLHEGKYGHVGIVTDYTEDTVTFTEANYVRCTETARTIEKTDYRIKGYR